MTTEEKFHAAVNVIRNLPKSGAYQPSYELMLRFYAYFKQATEGPCKQSKPAFWEVVKKMKWEAWNRLGNMSKQDAMLNYVEELKRIVETMSYNENVGNFLSSLGDFYDNVPVEDLELLLGPVIERVRSQPGSPLHGSPLGSRETSPTRVPHNLVNKKTSLSSLETSPVSSMSPSPQPPDTDEEEEFIDTVETTPHAARKSFSKSPNDSPTMSKKKMDSLDNTHAKTNGHIPSSTTETDSNMIKNGSPSHINGFKHDESENELDVSVGHRGRTRERESPNVVKRRIVKQNGSARSNTSSNGQYMSDLSEPIREAVLHLQKDLDRITARVRSLEVAALSQPSFEHFQSVELCENCIEKIDDQVQEFEENFLCSSENGAVRERSRWLPLSGVSPKTVLFILAWPFIAQLIVMYIQRRRRN